MPSPPCHAEARAGISFEKGIRLLRYAQPDKGKFCIRYYFYFIDERLAGLLLSRITQRRALSRQLQMLLDAVLEMPSSFGQYFCVSAVADLFIIFDGQNSMTIVVRAQRAISPTEDIAIRRFK